MTSKPLHQKEKLKAGFGADLVVDHGPRPLVVPLIDGQVGEDQLHLDLLNNGGAKTAVDFTVTTSL